MTKIFNEKFVYIPSFVDKNHFIGLLPQATKNIAKFNFEHDSDYQFEEKVLYNKTELRDYLACNQVDKIYGCLDSDNLTEVLELVEALGIETEIKIKNIDQATEQKLFELVRNNRRMKVKRT
ncbi:hypothetical protein [Ligilactobacillus ceti]|nr:hypothetical protein [Ligilactobacillus ceti]